MQGTSDTVKISVIIPAFNMARYLPSSVKSVLNGTFEDVEVIVVDDGSSDDTPRVVKGFADPLGSDYDARVRLFCKENGGKASAVNLALQKARGTFVTILDADDELSPDSLAVRYRKALQGAVPQEMVIGGFEVFDEHDAVLGVRPAPATRAASALRQAFWQSFKTPFHLSACLVARDLIDRTGALDPRLQRCQDIDYSLRLLAEACRVACVRAVVYRYRKHRRSIRQRMRYRFQTARYRPWVFWKNYQGGARALAVLSGLLLDAGKAVYELAANYRR